MSDLAQAQYEVYIGSSRGLRLAYVEGWTRLTAVLANNAVGRWSLTIPDGLIDDALIQRDAMVELWRAVPGRRPDLITVGFTRAVRYSDEGGVDMLTLRGPDANELLYTRIVTEGAINQYSRKTSTAADDVMKDIVRRSMDSSAADSDRDLSDYGLTVEADAGGGPTISRSYPRKFVLQVLQEIANAARAAGTRVLFGIVPIPKGDTLDFEFRTWITRRGADRTQTGGNPTFFGKEWGNLEAPDLVYDYSNEVTVVYAGGQGEGDDREVVEVEDSDRRNATPWNRREVWVDAATQNTTDEITEAARTTLDMERPRIVFNGTLKDTPQTRYGVDWEFGDTVTAEHRGLQFDGDVDKVRLDKSRDGLEVIETHIEVVQ